MTKKILFLLLLISSITFGQHIVKGTMSPKIKTDWLILYKLEGTKQVFVNNTTIKTDSVLIGGKKEVVSSFQIRLPSSAKPGAYRATYNLEGAGFIDFFYNKENVSFIFNPEYPQQSVVFSESSENIFYANYLNDITAAQQKLDSTQVAVLQDPSLDLKDSYKQAYKNVDSIQNKYVEDAKDMFIAPFIKASSRNNPSEILTSVTAYLDNIKGTYFNKLDFSNKALVNSSFLTNRILDYIFYINYSEDLQQQQILHKNAIETILSKIKSESYKRDIIEFLIEQFESAKNLDIIDYLFESQYNKLSPSLQDAKFKEEKQALFAAEVGRIAPDFSWTENGKKFKLSTLNDAESYVLVFWSTSCSHCLREIPELYTYMKTKPNLKVIAFALEKDTFVWDNYQKSNLRGWHNVLGLNKWENETAQTYQVFSTPSYFVLDKNKKIIAKPNEINDVKEFLKDK
ncbi:TlpA family protein disulfide reductase [Polaribacter sp. Asnod6-C07]|uniref:TlpA family protein disulfide reductase n=1 Tax=Polaribacter sp. Asnod6-C07 TaxID=3160582 RepID=UPI0038681696